MPKTKFTYTTTDQLIEILKKFPKGTPVGRVGHFGELLDNISIKKSKAYPVPKGKNWRVADQSNTIEIAELEVETLGPDPD